MEPYQDPQLAVHTRNVDTFLRDHCPASSVRHGVPTGAANTPLQLLQQRFEEDMSSSVWRAFQGLPCSSDKVDPNYAPFFLPGYGDYRRKPVKQRRSHKLSRKSHLDMYLDHSLQEARLGDLWSSTSTSTSIWADMEPEYDTVAPIDTAHAMLPTQLDDKAFLAAADCTAATSPQAATLYKGASTSTSSSSCTEVHRVDQFGDAARHLAHVAGLADDPKFEAQAQLNMPQVLMQAFQACLVLLPMLWVLQQMIAPSRQEPSALMGRLRLGACWLFIPLFLYLTTQLLAESWAACTAHLHFADPSIEARFASWFATWTWPPDAFLTALWTAASLYAWTQTHAPALLLPPRHTPATLAAPQPSSRHPPTPHLPTPTSPDAGPRWLALASGVLPRTATAPAFAPHLACWLALAGILLPALLRAATLALRARHRAFSGRHELSIVCAKLTYAALDAFLLSLTTTTATVAAAAATAAASTAPSQLHTSWRQWMLLAPLLGMALTQVRVAAFLPPQLLHALVVLLLGPAGLRTALHVAHVLALGVCLPALWLYAKERAGRRRFVGLGLAKEGAMLPGAATAGITAATMTRLCSRGP